MARGFVAGRPALLTAADGSGLPLTDDLAEAEWLLAVWTPGCLTVAALEDFTGADELLALVGPCACGMEIVPFTRKTGGGVRFTACGIGGS